MSLTTTAYASRNLIKYGIVGLFGFSILWISATAAIKSYKQAHPPYVAPTLKYGILPKIVFPDKSFEKKTFTLELPTQSVPNFGDQAKVYFISRPSSVVLALEQDKQIAQSFGFTDNPLEIKSGVYQFTNTASNLTLTMNVLEGNFDLKYPYENDQMLLISGMAPDKVSAIGSAVAYLQQAGKYTTDLENGEQKVSFWKIDNSGLNLVDSQSEANLTRVDFFRQPLDDKFQILSTDTNKAMVSALVSGSTVTDKKIVELNYRYSQIDREAYSTYYIKGTTEAYQDLAAGNYWPASDISGPSTTIRKISLAYFEPVSLTNFLVPIYVFEGDGGFTAYVSAIDNKWIQK